MIKYFLVFLSVVFCISCASIKPATYGALGNDKSLYYYHLGKGEPIIIIHGGPGLNHQYLLPHLERLALNHQLIFYDQKACGDSEIPQDTNALKLSAFVEDITTIQKAFGHKKTHLLAHSWGSSLALRYALKHPDRISSLLLISPAATSSEDSRKASRELNQRYEYADQIKRNTLLESSEFKSGAASAMVKLMKISFSKNMVIPQKADSLRVYLPLDYAKKNTALRFLFKDLADYDLYPELRKIKIPTLIVAGDYDVSEVNARRLADSVQNAKYVRIAEAGHFPFLEQPKLFDEAIHTFMKTLKPPTK